MIADSRSSVIEPTVSVVLMILKASSGEGSVATTSAFVIGIETGPNCVIGCPHASIFFGSM